MQPVRIAGRVYWDGGFSSNPPLWPLLEGDRGRTKRLLVLLDPRTEPSVPATAPEIGARLSWLAFGQPLARELAAMERARTTGAFGGLFRRRLRRHRLTFIEAGDAVAGLGRASKLMPERKLVLRLKEAGRAAGEAWLVQRFDGARDAARALPRPGAARAIGANAIAARSAA